MEIKAFKKLNNLIKNGTFVSWKKSLVAVFIVVTFCASLTLTFTCLAATVYNVGVAGSSDVTRVHTFDNDPVSIVESVGIDMSEEDLIAVTSVNGGDNSNVTVYRDGHTTVTVDGAEQLVETSGTVEKTIADAGIVLYPDDDINVNLHAIAYDGMEIEIDRAYTVYVEADGRTYDYVTTGCTASEVVSDLGIAMADGDEYSVPADTELKSGDTVKVLRCSYAERSAVEEIECHYAVVPDDNLYEGQTRIIEEGTNGSRAVVYIDKYLNGEVVESTEKTSEILTEPTEGVKAVGTKVFSIKSGAVPISKLTLPADLRFDEKGLPVNYDYYIDGVATAYCGGGITATGRPAGVGYVAVDPKVIPYGTKMWVVSLDGRYVYGYAIAADTGGFVEGGWADMDLYMNTESECYDFGIRGVRIYIL